MKRAINHISLLIICVFIASVLLIPSMPNIHQQSQYHLQLELDQQELEYGNKLTVKYGLLDNSSNYVSNQSYRLYLLNTKLNTNNITLTENNSTLLEEGNTTSMVQSLIVDTLPSTSDTLKPGNYSIFFTVNVTLNNSTLSNYKNFEIFRHEGANVEITFSDYQTKEKIDKPYNLEKNKSRRIIVQLTNLGEGNAVDIYFAPVNFNGPIEYNSSSTPYSLPVLDSLEQVSLNFTVKTPTVGIGIIQFNLIYNNTLGRTLQIGRNFVVHTLPEITLTSLRFSDTSSIQTGKNTRITITINNHENINVTGILKPISTKVTFSPSQSREVNLFPGKNTFEFVAIPIENGTANIELIFTFIDPDGEDMVDMNLGNTNVQISGSITPIDNDQIDWPLVIAIILYLILIVGLIILLVRKEFRDVVINKALNSGFSPDIDYNKQKIIVDGSNIAWEEVDENGDPKIENIEAAISTLEEYGFKEITIVADAALRYQISDPEDLDKKVKAGDVKVLPAKVDGDMFILRYSRDNDTLILTNDLFKEYRDKFSWIDERRVPYTIINGNFYLHPLYDLEEKNALKS